jgi:hypothetical protein
MMRRWMFLGLTACGGGGGAGIGPCDLPATADAIAGSGVRDCGFFTDNGEGPWACANEAFGAGAAFVLRWDVDPGDAVVHHAVAFDRADVWLLQQDTFGGNDRIDGWNCRGPAVETGPSGWDEITCAFLDPEFNHYLVCGDDGGEIPAPIPFPKVF